MWPSCVWTEDSVCTFLTVLVNCPRAENLQCQYPLMSTTKWADSGSLGRGQRVVIDYDLRFGETVDRSNVRPPIRERSPLVTLARRRNATASIEKHG